MCFKRLCLANDSMKISIIILEYKYIYNYTELPVISMNASKVIVNMSESVVVTCEVTGEPTPKIWWDTTHWQTHNQSSKVQSEHI